MKDFEISGHHIRLDLGAMKIMAKQTGLDATDPMHGITDNVQVLATIMYGGMARAQERSGKAATHTFDQVVSLLDDFSQGEMAQIVQAWNESKEIPEQKKSE